MGSGVIPLSISECNLCHCLFLRGTDGDIAHGTAPFVQLYRFNNNAFQSIGTIVTSSEVQVQVPCSSLLFRRSFEFLIRKKKGIERIEKNAVTRSLSFDTTCTTTRKKYLKRISDLDITPIIVQEMDDRTLVNLNGERIDFNLRKSSEENSSSSKLVNKKVFCCEATSAEVENYVDADKSQEIRTLRNINKILARKLAKTERIAQLLQIQLKFYDKTNDAKFACRLADVIDQLKLVPPDDRFRDEALEVLNSASPSIGANDEKSVFLNNLLKEIEYDKSALLNSGTLRKCYERLVEYARRHPPVLMELQNQINEITSLEANLMLYREQLAMKDARLRQLEEEIGNAHRCNQQLNAKLGSMVTTNNVNFLNQEKELKNKHNA
ncbi:unnamed protein product [Acanthocheilonema viteae]|uniref:Uncharacterized protein n=1 Tax=Acanthocheilonema viteae TaxID=6277 RepID=A0A498SL75_ACAVI|nr:unnamed protein product [Acanthocheilonema viteae]